MIFGPWDCMGWSPPLQGGNSGGFDSHKVHQEFILGLFFMSCAFDDENGLVVIKKHLPNMTLWQKRAAILILRK